MGRGDSRIETAAVDGRVGDADDEPRTMTCRFVDLSADKRLDGGAARCSAPELEPTQLMKPVRPTFPGYGHSLALQVDIIPLDT